MILRRLGRPFAPARLSERASIAAKAAAAINSALAEEADRTIKPRRLASRFRKLRKAGKEAVLTRMRACAVGGILCERLRR